MSDWSPPELSAYLDGLVPPRPAELQEMEALAAREGFPIIGPACGQWCYQIARLTGARRIFELGSGFGYSTAWFARAVLENGGGTVHHTVWDADLSDQARNHLERLGLNAAVEYHLGEAVATLRETPGPFDIIFNDIDKEQYPGSLDVIEARLRPGGVLIIDNMLWGGRVFNPDDRHASTEGIRAFTRRVSSDPNWSISFLPVRDGMIVARRA